MDHEVMGLEAFVLIALEFVHFHDVLSWPAKKVNVEGSGHQKVFVANRQLLCM